MFSQNIQIVLISLLLMILLFTIVSGVGTKEDRKDKNLYASIQYLFSIIKLGALS